MRVREKEKEREREKERKREGEREKTVFLEIQRPQNILYTCVCERERERGVVNSLARNPTASKQFIYVCVCVCVCVRERERVCVCVNSRARNPTAPNLKTCYSFYCGNACIDIDQMLRMNQQRAYTVHAAD